MMTPERLEAVRQSITNEEKFRYDHSAEVRADRRLLLRDRDELAALVTEARIVLRAATFTGDINGRDICRFCDAFRGEVHGEGCPVGPWLAKSEAVK